MARGLGPRIAALRVLDDELGELVARVVVEGAEEAGESHEQRIVLSGQADDVHGLAAPDQPVDRGLRRLLARREAVVVVVVPRVEALLHRRDRDGIDALILALVVGLALREDLRRGEWILPA